MDDSPEGLAKLLKVITAFIILFFAIALVLEVFMKWTG